MNLLRFYINHIDQAVLSLCVVFTLVNTIRLVRRATEPIRRLPAVFLVFGATSIATLLGAGHLLEISFRALERALAGTFVFNFRFYSLILLGIVLLTQGLGMLRNIGAWFRGVPGSQRSIVQSALFIVVVSAPAGLLTPIGYVPTIACAISLVSLPLVIKKSARKHEPGPFAEIQSAGQVLP